MEFNEKLQELRKNKGLHKKNLQKLSMCPEQQFLNGNQAEDIRA